MRKTAVILSFLFVLSSVPLHSQNNLLRDWIDNYEKDALLYFTGTNTVKEHWVSWGDYLVPSVVFAQLQGKKDVASLLIGQGLDINSLVEIDGQEDCPLSLALEQDDWMSTFLLLDQGVELSISLEHKYYGKRFLFADLMKKSIVDKKTLDSLTPQEFRFLRKEIYKVLKQDNELALKRLYDKYPWLNTIKLDLELNKEDQNYYENIMEAAVYFGAYKCVKYINEEDDGSHWNRMANDAVRFNQTGILKYAIKDLSQSDLPYLLQDAYYYTNRKAVKIILNHIKNIDKVFMFNGASVFDYAWSTGDADIVMDTILSYPASSQVKKAFQLVRKGDYTALTRMVNKDNVKTFQADKDAGLLHLSAFLGDSRITRYLLDCGADPGRETDYLGSQPIYLAAIKGHRNIVLMLKEASAALLHYHVTHITDEAPFSLVDYVYLRFGHALTRVLLDTGVDNTIELSGYGIYSHDLHIAIKKHDIIHVRYLLEKYEPQMAQCIIPMRTAIKYHHLDILKMFFELGYDKNLYNILVSYAIEFDDLEAYEYLVSNNSKYDTGMDSWQAVRFDAVNILRKLLRENADVNAVFKKGSHSEIEKETTLLHTAVKSSADKAVQLLLDKGADAGYIDTEGRSLLYIAADYHDQDVLRLLLEAGAPPNTWIYEDTGEMIYQSGLFWMDDDQGRNTRTVLDFVKDYGLYKILRGAGAKYSWEVLLGKEFSGK